MPGFLKKSAKTRRNSGSSWAACTPEGWSLAGRGRLNRLCHRASRPNSTASTPNTQDQAVTMLPVRSCSSPAR